ncbi:JAB domain-containing protein [Escherichia coli]
MESACRLSTNVIRLSKSISKHSLRSFLHCAECVFLAPSDSAKFIAFLCKKNRRATVSVHPREVIKRVLKHNAAAVILVHNHPSGEPEPSRCDIKLTKKLQELLEMLDVRLLDHFIVAGTETVSMAERGLV